jgi:hypothetical protein
MSPRPEDLKECPECHCKEFNYYSGTLGTKFICANKKCKSIINIDSESEKYLTMFELTMERVINKKLVPELDKRYVNREEFKCEQLKTKTNRKYLYLFSFAYIVFEAAKLIFKIR